jgi:hypothetical protein
MITKQDIPVQKQAMFDNLESVVKSILKDPLDSVEKESDILLTKKFDHLLSPFMNDETAVDFIEEIKNSAPIKPITTYVPIEMYDIIETYILR